MAVGASRTASRVAITGLGVVSSQGIGIGAFWANLILGVPRVTVLPTLGLDIETYMPYGATIPDFQFAERFPDHQAYGPWIDRGMEFALVAADEAVCDSGFQDCRSLIADDRVGVYVASCTGGLTSAVAAAERHLSSAAGTGFDMRTLYAFTPGMWPAILAHRFRAGGPALSWCISCAAGGEAIGQCYRDVKHGIIDIGICGGADAPIVKINVLSFYLVKAASRWKGDPSGACRPFSRDRCGMVFGEGAAFLVLENYRLARERNAHIYGEVIGYGATSDGHHMTAPAELAERYAAAVTRALVDGGVPPEAVGYVSTHGTGTVLNDRAETLALKRALGRHASAVPVSAIKSMIGHAFGGASAIETVSAVQALQTQIAPPTINYTESDPLCDLDCVPNVCRPICAEIALKTATGFGGSNIALLIRRAPL